jgi:hypothetical protein
MKKITYIFLTTLLIVSCKTKTEKENIDSQADTPTMDRVKQAPSLEEGCYAYNANGNQIVFEITDVSVTVLGNLSYALKEKDSNKGTFAGTLNDSILLGKYTFMSEGKQSTREVAFLVENGQLIEGFGELDSTGTAFKNINVLSFSSSMPLSKTECDTEP